MTQYLLAVHTDFDDVANTDEAEMHRAIAQVDAFNTELQASGNWVFAGGLTPPSDATVVDAAAGEAVLTDGPYAETKEVLGGFWVVEVADLDAALEIAQRASKACMGKVEVRPFQGE